MRRSQRLTRRAALSAIVGASLMPAVAGCAFRADAFAPGIYAVPVAGGEPRLVVPDPARPVPSPRGSLVAWSSDTGVWLVPIDGNTQPTRLATTSMAAAPAWSPDASRLAWVDRGTREIHVAAPDGPPSESVPLLAPGDDRGLVAIALRNQPSWAPDGSAFAFLSWDGNGDEVYRIAPDGSGRLQLSSIRSSGEVIDGERSDGQTKAIGDAVRPAWSPDGNRVAFGVAPETAGAPGGVFVVNADGTRQRRLSPLLTGYGPQWSPDGSSLLIVLHGAEGPALCIVDTETREVRNLTADSGLVPLDAAWSPDGQRIAFSANAAIHLMNLASGDTVTLADTPLDDRAPAWTPDGDTVLFMASDDLFALPAMPDIP